MDILAKCPRCDSSETLFHVFFYCDNIVACWERMSFSYRQSVNLDVVHWVAYVCKNARQEELAEFFCCLWKIWFGRNDLL